MREEPEATGNIIPFPEQPKRFVAHMTIQISFITPDNFVTVINGKEVSLPHAKEILLQLAEGKTQIATSEEELHDMMKAAVEPLSEAPTDDLS